jgi:hypothetical protein
VALNLFQFIFFSASCNIEYAVTIVKKGIEARWPESTIKLIDIDTIGHILFPNLNDNYPAIGLGFPVCELALGDFGESHRYLSEVKTNRKKWQKRQLQIF